MPCRWDVVALQSLVCEAGQLVRPGPRGTLGHAPHDRDSTDARRRLPPLALHLRNIGNMPQDSI